MMLNEGSVYEFDGDTLGPISAAYVFKHGAYFCYTSLCLTYRYTLTSCPSHLTRAGFDNLEAKNANATISRWTHSRALWSWTTRIESHVEPRLSTTRYLTSQGCFDRVGPCSGGRRRGRLGTKNL
ncbi:hypothetical protein V8E55_010392 [Tylopilus felleus]